MNDVILPSAIVNLWNNFGDPKIAYWSIRVCQETQELLQTQSRAV